MSMQRRIGRLEAAKPDHPMSVRVIFNNEQQRIDQDRPLAPNEMLIAVSFVGPTVRS